MNIIITILLSTVKFGMTFPLAIMEFKFGFFETIIWINLGGILGIYFFAYLSKGLIDWVKKLVKNRSGEQHRAKRKRENKKIFTKRNRKIIRIKQRYGLFGIAASTPILFSIPVGAFLVVRYYPRVKTRFLTMILANFIWSLFYTSFYMFWNQLLFVS